MAISPSADAFYLGKAEQRRSAPATPEDRLVERMLQAVRGTHITAGPPAHVRPPLWSDPVDMSTRVSVPAAVQPLYVTALSYRVPPGRSARIERYGVNVQDAAYQYDGSILWAFRLNGQFIDHLYDWGQQRGSIVFPRRTVIILKENDLLQFMVKRAVAAAGAQNVEMTFEGWEWRMRNNFEGTQSSVGIY